MKKILLICSVFLAMVSCQEDYELNADFTVPTELNSPASIQLDVSSSVPVVLSWSGGGAADGGIVLYEVLFDKADGDFSKPLATMIPAELYLYGSATENSGQGGIPFRCVEEGVFQIYTKLSAGNISFKSATTGETFSYYIDDSSKLREGDGETAVTASEEVTRLTVNFNTMAMTTEKIGSSVRCIWGATFADIAVLQYVGNGKFVGEGDIRFLDPSKPETNPPSWLTYIEERYYFIAQVNGGDMCWGRGDGVSAERPVGGEPASFYALYEFQWSQWEHLWKMKGSLDYTHATITIDTNADGLMIHTFTNVTPIN